MPKRPRHVIWITTDHMRYDNIARHQAPYMHTPHLDRLVDHGVDFGNCFAQNPLCMPSRASFMTGCYPHQTGVLANGQDLSPDFPYTVARAFGGGYQTTQIGKLHFQSHEENDLDPRARNDYGFDVFWCDEEPGCYDGPYLRWLASEDPSLVPLFRTPRPAAPNRNDVSQVNVIDASWEYSFSGWIAEQTRRFLGSWGGGRGRDEHHFVHMGFYAPHPPLNPTRDMMEPYTGVTIPPARKRDSEADDKPSPLCDYIRHRNLSDEEEANYRKHFAAMVTGVDFAVGKLLETLTSLGVLDDTLIVFGSDHGDFCGDHGLVLKSNAWYDSVCRMPLIMHWPNGFGTDGLQLNGLVEMVDIMPTLLDFCRIPVPDAMTGRSWADQILQKDTMLGRVDVLAVDNPGHLMLRTETHKYIRWDWLDGAVSEVLYDLQADPEEFTNVAQDPSYSDVMARMRTRALERIMHATRPLTQKIFRF